MCTWKIYHVKHRIIFLIRPQIEVIKKVKKYQALVVSIKSFEERKDNKGRTLSTGLIGASQTVHRYNDDQKKPHTDYIPVSVHPQFNKRALYLSL